MKIIDSAAGSRNNSSAAVKVKSAPRQTAQSAPPSAKRDRAEFDRSLISYAKTIKSSVRSELDYKSNNKPESAITSDEISAEIERLKTRAPKTAEAALQTAEPDPIQQSSIQAKSTKARSTASSSSDNSVADMLNEQIKQISELLSKNSSGMSRSVYRQLTKIYTLLREQEKTDPNSVSKTLQKEIDKLSEIISAEEPDNDNKPLHEILKNQQSKLSSLFSRVSNSDNTLSGIRNKIRQGRRLTATERQYLSSKDPAAYESYCKINVARTMFRCSLKNCRTRDDVIGMRLSNALSALSSYKKSIREGGDGSDVIALNAAFENELRSFSSSSGYRSLPTAAECNKFDKDLANARKYEREKRLEKQREQQERLRCKKYKKRIKKTPGDGKRTVAQVLADPTSKKVIASRAKQTYCECSAVSFSMYKTLNSKA